jgi:hypothetical protein
MQRLEQPEVKAHRSEDWTDMKIPMEEKTKARRSEYWKDMKIPMEQWSLE